MNCTHSVRGVNARTSLCSMAIVASLGSAGCTTLGGNVSGDFACRAPGGSCSPMSAIDARAVETVLGAAAGDPEVRSKRHPFRPPAVSGPVSRTGERTLRIVFPAHVDRAGVLHDEASAHVVVEDAAWTMKPPASAARTVSTISGAAFDFQISRSPAPSSLREAIAGASAPAIEGLESPPAQAPHPIRADAQAPPRTVRGPTAEALAAARTGRRIARPGWIDPSPVPLERSQARPAIGGSKPSKRPATGKPEAAVDGTSAAGRVRALAKPAIEKLGRAPSEPDLDSVFGPAAGAKDAPK